jgi:hypothetical protein
MCGKKMAGYQCQDGCHNCESVFIWDEWDDPLICYCDFDGDRPPCTSVFLKELNKLGIKIGDKRWRKAHDKWNKWEEKHRVESWGICHLFDLREEKA